MIHTWKMLFLCFLFNFHCWVWLHSFLRFFHFLWVTFIFIGRILRRGWWLWWWLIFSNIFFESFRFETKFSVFVCWIHPIFGLFKIIIWIINVCTKKRRRSWLINSWSVKLIIINIRTGKSMKILDSYLIPPIKMIFLSKQSEYPSILVDIHWVNCLIKIWKFFKETIWFFAKSIPFWKFID